MSTSRREMMIQSAAALAALGGTSAAASASAAASSAATSMPTSQFLDVSPNVSAPADRAAYALPSKEVFAMAPVTKRYSSADPPVTNLGKSRLAEMLGMTPVELTPAAAISPYVVIGQNDAYVFDVERRVLCGVREIRLDNELLDWKELLVRLYGSSYWYSNSRGRWNKHISRIGTGYGVGVECRFSAVVQLWPDRPIGPQWRLGDQQDGLPRGFTVAGFQHSPVGWTAAQVGLDANLLIKTEQSESERPLLVHELALEQGVLRHRGQLIKSLVITKNETGLDLAITPFSQQELDDAEAKFSHSPWEPYSLGADGGGGGRSPGQSPAADRPPLQPLREPGAPSLARSKLWLPDIDGIE